MSARSKATARLLVSVPFVSGGAEALTDPTMLISVAKSKGIPVPAVVVRVSASAMLCGGIALAAGVAPRATAASLAAALLGVTVTVHAFWLEEAPQARAAHRRMFIQNLALTGALILTAESP